MRQCGTIDLVMPAVCPDPPSSSPQRPPNAIVFLGTYHGLLSGEMIFYPPDGGQPHKVDKARKT